jgi:ornithine cyclodeaminase
MRVVELPEIRSAIDEAEILEAVEQGFRLFSSGQVSVTAVGHLTFTTPRGDCHIKSGYVQGDGVFVVKVASAFHGNAGNNGFMAVLSARTGDLLAILHDHSYLTDLRTAVAGAIAARLIARRQSQVLGVVGAGVQARMQAHWIARVLNIGTTLVWARNPERAQSLGFESVSLAELCERADLIVTTTPSTEPLITGSMIHAGARIVAVGADSPGKRELSNDLMAKARIIVDSRIQCIDHGETAWAIRAGLVAEHELCELGEALEARLTFTNDDIVVADLTGVAVQDVQIAKAIWARLPHS